MSNILKIQDLHKIIIDQISICGFSIVLIKQINKHPLHLLVKYNNEEFDLRIFVLNITHGGKTRADDEFRIQPNHHKVYDNGLLYINEQYQIGINKSKIENLKEVKLDSGIENFIKNTRHIISLPNNRIDYPSILYITNANKLRLAL